MSLLSDATALNVGGTAVTKVLHGTTEVWSAVPTVLPGASSVSLSDSTTYVSTPDHADFDVVDVDCRVSLSTPVWPPSPQAGVLGGQQGSSPNRRWSMMLAATTGRPIMVLSTTGSNTVYKTGTAAPPGAAADTMMHLRFVLDPDNGASGYTCRFYSRTDTDIHLNTGWTQIGADVVTATAFTLPFSAATLQVGHNQNQDTPLPGKYRRMVLMSGIAGTVVADFDATKVSFTAPQLPTTYTDTTGKVWTMQGASWNWNA